MIYIYGLIERNAEVKGIRYIGLTGNPDHRLISHRDPSESTGKAAWVKDLLLSGNTIDMVILDKADTRDEAHRLEASWIKFGEERGWELTNSIRPSGDCLPLPPAPFDDASPRMGVDMIAKLFDAHEKTEGRLHDLRQEISTIGKIVARTSQKSLAQKSVPYSRSPLLGAIRQCIMGAILLTMAQVVSSAALMAGADLSWFIDICLYASALFAIYPIWFLSKIGIMWLFGQPSVKNSSGADGSEYRLNEGA